MMVLFKNEGLCCLWCTSSTTRSISLWALCKIHFGCWQVLWPQSEQTGNVEESITPMVTPHWWAGVRQLHKCKVIFIRLQGLFYWQCELVHMAQSCCSERSPRYIVLAITAGFISNYLVFSSHIQHLLFKWSLWRLMTEWVSPPTVFSFIVFPLWLVSECMYMEA